MKNINTSAVLLLLAFMFVFSSCSLLIPDEYNDSVEVDKDNPKQDSAREALAAPDNMILGTWSLTQFLIGGKDEMANSWEYLICTFYEDGTGHHILKPPLIREYTEDFTWQISDGQLVLNNEGIVFTTAIDTLTEDTLIEICGDSPYSDTYIYTRVESDAWRPERPDVTALNIYSFTEEVPRMFPKFQELYPELGLDINMYTFATADISYDSVLDAAIAAGGPDAPDIYCVESAYALKYTQGDACPFACPYSELGIDVDRLLAEAQIAQYIVDIGTNPKGQIVGLSYQATGGAFIYRRSIAKDVWGTDDPAVIKYKIGPGMDKFFEAAEVLKNKGYAIISSVGDIWHVIEGASPAQWIVDGKLGIDPSREEFLDWAMELKEKGYSNDTVDWLEDWFTDMTGKGPKPVFGYLGPAWFVNYVLEGNCGDTFGDWAICEPPAAFYWGGTWLLANKETKFPEAVGKFIEWVTLDSSDTGLQYFWAGGMMNGQGRIKDTVASIAVMKRCDGSLDILGGQDMFDVFIPACESATGINRHQYDDIINSYWRSVVRNYTAGSITREQAIESFKQQVADTLGVVAD